MIAIVRGLPRFDGRSAFSTWAYRVAANASLDELRRRGRRSATSLNGADPDHEFEPADPNGDRAFAAIDDRVAHHQALEQAIAALPEEFRVAVVLRDVADFDYTEIAERLGVPLGTVKSRIARGRGLLARALDPTLTGNPAAVSQRPTEAP